MKNYLNKRILVTGGAGFIGSNLVDKLIDGGHKVVIIDNLSTGKKENINPAAKFVLADITNFDEIKPWFTDVDWVFHTAALARVQPSIEDPITFNEVNVNGTLNVLLAAREANVNKVIYSSSSSVYGNQTKMPLKEEMAPQPISPYALQKYISELYGRLFSEIYHLPTVSLRYFNIYGKRQPIEGAYALVIGIFTRQKLKGEPLTIFGDGEQRRDYTNVEDVVRANILAAQSEKVGRVEVINIGSGKNYSVNDLAKIFGGENIHLPPKIEPRETLADNFLAKKLLGWEPKVNLLDWLEQYKKDNETVFFR